MVDLRVEHLDLKAPGKVHLHGKGDKWRTCPLWEETAKHLERLLAEGRLSAGEPVFCARRARGTPKVRSHDALLRTCFGIPLPFTCWNQVSR